MADDAGQFAAFVHAHSRQLQRAAWLLTGDWQTAEDLVQTALTTTWQRWSTIRQPGARLTYTRRVLLTTFISDARRRRVTEVAFEAAGDPPSDHDPAGESVQREVLLAALDVLPRQQRAVVVLRYFCDLSERDTADALGCGPGTVKSSASRALAKLRTDSGLAGVLTDGGR